MIRLNHQRILRQRLPIKFLCVTLAIAFLWFIVMFLYVDDLISEEARDTRLLREKVKSNVWKSVGGNHGNGFHGDESYGGHEKDNMVIYDNETGRHIEIERVEEEYVEVWDHGRWVRGTEKYKGLTSVKSRQITQPANTHGQGDMRFRSSASNPKRKSETQDVPVQEDARKVSPKDEEIILLDDDNNTKDIKIHNYIVVPSIPSSSTRARPVGEQQHVNGNIENAVHDHQPGRDGGEAPGVVAQIPRGNEDFHFAVAQKEVLPLTNPVPKIPATTTIHSTRPPRIYHKNLVLNQPAVRTINANQSQKFLHLKGQSNRPIAQPLLAGAPRRVGISKRSVHYGQNGRRTKYARQRYQEAQHVNVNAKPGSRINYVNVKHKTNWTQSVSKNKLKWSSQHHPMQSSTRRNDFNKTNLHRHRLKAGGLAQPAILLQKPEPLSADSQLDLEDGYNRHSFNVTASQALPLLRQLPDTRPKSCFFNTPTVTSVLPVATVVICFHNEAWSTLLRTVHSVLARAADHLLKEIILVDDYSSYDYLGAKLETYIAKFPKIQLVRTHKREGLIRARILGVSYARGDVLVFLDSHCECNVQWLEPLLISVSQDRRKIVCPQIDIITPDRFTYERAPANMHGGFNWHMQFAWKVIPDHERLTRIRESDPIRTPTMIGGLFAVDRRYFLDIGSYDSGMEIWGGENLELSFRVWMCGGSIEISPCSRVGHVFRPVIPYGFPAGPRQTLHHNAMRVVEVWLDQYKKFYYASQELKREDKIVESLADRQQLRLSLKCYDFSWYLKNIIPEMDIPPLNAHYYGQVRNGKLKYCLHSTESGVGATLKMLPCQEQVDSQQFTVTSSGEFVHYFQCMHIIEDIPALASCTMVNQRWNVTKEGLVQAVKEKGQMLCLDVRGFSVAMATCDNSKTSQLWTFTYRFDTNKLNMKY